MSARRPGPRGVAAVVVVTLLVATVALVVRGGDEAGSRTVTAHFPRAVSVYEGTEVRILGVPVGHVTAVVPEGDSVRVDMEYDGEQRLPADAKAVVVTPTLVADRFVQLTPAWSGGPTLPDGADIALPDTGVPVELDRIYASLRDLSEALGPNGVNRHGTLDHLLRAGATHLRGEGRLGNQMISDLADAAETFGEGSGDLFATVDELARFTKVLGANDRLVRAFLRDLASMSRALVTERGELQRALGSVARAVGEVKGFVHDNRQALVTDLEQLTRVMKTISSESDSLDTALRVGPLALGNLAVAFNTETGSIGSRVGFQGTVADADGLLCAFVMQSDLPRTSKTLACRIFSRLLEPAEGQASKQTAAARPTRLSQVDPAARSLPQQYGVARDPDGTLSGLLGGGS